MKLHQALPNIDYQVVEINDGLKECIPFHIGDVVQYDIKHGVYFNNHYFDLTLDQCNQIEVQMKQHEMVLSKLQPGMSGKIAHVSGKTVVKRRLLDMGFTKGAVVHVIKEAPLGDPVEYEVRGYSLTLRKSETSHIFIEPLEEENE